jgi:N-acetylglucosamine kinase-like BadF-type ATPase
LAGSENGWGVALVAGTGCNCWGWTENRSKIAHVSGAGDSMGERAGATELVAKAVQQVAFEWTTRGSKTALSSRFMEISGAKSLTELIEFLSTGKYIIEPSAAPLIFTEAKAGDVVSRDVIRWAGNELGELAGCVIRQLNLEEHAFDLVLIGSLFEGGELLISPLIEKIQNIAPHARIQHLTVPPVVGAVFLAMENSGYIPSNQVKQALMQNISYKDLL